MRLLFSLLSLSLLASGAFASEPSAPPQQLPALSQVSVPAPAEKKAGVGTHMASPKIHAIRATRNADGSLAIDCTERPNPKIKSLPITTPAARTQQ